MANNWPDGGEQPSGPIGTALFFAGSWALWGLMATAALLWGFRVVLGPLSMPTTAGVVLVGFALAGLALWRVAKGKA
jgi:hypothetical protein